MYYKEVFETLATGTKVKLTVSDKIIGQETFYFANVINTDLEPYKKDSSLIGVEISDGKGQTVYYRDVERLLKDIHEKYGTQWLESEV